MSCEDIIRALRCTSTPGGPTGDCEKCPYWKTEQMTAEQKEKLGVDTWTSCDVDKVGMDAADLIERLTAENAALREKQAEAEAERDALLEQIKARRSCLDCKHFDYCEFDNATVIECMNCVTKNCPCAGCCDSSRWEWRGLPEAPEEGDKHE